MGNTRKSIDVRKLAYTAILTAIVVVLQLIPIKIGTFELALSVPVIIIGAALCGIGTGAWLGFVFGAVVLMLPGTAAFLSFSPVGTVLTVLCKGVLSGIVAAFVLLLFEKKNRYFALGFSAVMATVTNTGVFLIGSLLFFEANIAYVVSVFISFNFLIELAINLVLVPTVFRIINIKKR